MADDIQRWSEELARDPSSKVFVPLADALRRRGQLDLARKIVTRGLEKHPRDGDAHDVMARIWADRGETQRAVEQWEIALECAPRHPGALKGLAFAHFQSGRLADAERLLVEAVAADPDDASIRSAVVRVRGALGISGPPRPGAPSALAADAPAWTNDMPGAATPLTQADAGTPGAPPRHVASDVVQAAVSGAADDAGLTGTDVAGTDVAGTDVAGTDIAGTDIVGTDIVGTDIAGAEVPATAPADISVGAADVIAARDTSTDVVDVGTNAEPVVAVPDAHTAPAGWSEFEPEPAIATGERGPAGFNPVAGARQLFADFLGSGEQTALLLDGQGLVVAGTYFVADGRDVAEEVGAALSGVSDEANRAMRHLELGEWTSIMFETDATTVAMGPLRTAALPEDGIVLVAAARSVPLGFVRRLLRRVSERGATWLGAVQADGGA